MAFTSVHKIRFDDVDGAGIVYYPQYFHLCHAAFEDFFDDAAPLSYPELISKRRLGFPTVHIESDFTAPMVYGDIAVINIQVSHLGKSSARFRYAIRRKRDGEQCFVAEITTVFMNLDSKRSEPIPSELRTILSSFLRAS